MRAQLLTHASALGVVRALVASHAPEAFEARLDAGGAGGVRLAVEERQVGLDEIVRVDADRQTSHHVVLAPECTGGDGCRMN